MQRLDASLDDVAREDRVKMHGEQSDIAHFRGPVARFRIIDIALPSVQSEHGVGVRIAAQTHAHAASDAETSGIVEKFLLRGALQADAPIPDQRRQLVPAMMRTRIDLDIAASIVFSHPCEWNGRAKIILAVVAHGV